MTKQHRCKKYVVKEILYATNHQSYIADVIRSKKKYTIKFRFQV